MAETTGCWMAGYSEDCWVDSTALQTAVQMDLPRVDRWADLMASTMADLMAGQSAD